MSTSLFNYIRQIDDIIASATDEDGVIDYESIKDEFEALTLKRDEKIDNIISFIKSRKAMAEALKAEKNNIAKRQQQAEREVERMKEYLAFCLDGSKWESTAGKVSYRKSQQVVIDDIDALPEEYIRIERVPSKSAIKEDLKQGVIVHGAHMVDNINVTIR
mgnify:CR=1 FL=1